MSKASDTRRKMIDETALRLFAERGYAEVSIRDIAKACGIGESAIYRHTKSKEALAIRVFREAYLGFAEEMSDAAEGREGLEQTLGAYLEVMLEGFDEDPVLLRFLLIQQHDILAQAIKPEDITPLTLLRATIARAMAVREVPKRDPDIATAMVMGAALQPLTFMMFGRIPAPATSHHSTLLEGLMRLLGKS